MNLNSLFFRIFFFEATALAMAPYYESRIMNQQHNPQINESYFLSDNNSPATPILSFG